MFSSYMPTQSCESTALGSPELVKQVIGLKDEIKYLKCKLASALTDVGRGMDDIRASQFRLRFNFFYTCICLSSLLVFLFSLNTTQ